MGVLSATRFWSIRVISVHSIRNRRRIDCQNLFLFVSHWCSQMDIAYTTHYESVYNALRKTLGDTAECTN